MAKYEPGQDAGFLADSTAHDQAVLRTDVHCVDLVRPSVRRGDGSGSDSDTVTVPDGTIVNARDRDGVHRSRASTKLLAPILWQTFAPQWHLTG